MNAGSEIVESVGVDYLTVTHAYGDGHETFKALAYRALKEQSDAGNDTLELRVRDYEVVKCGAAMYGERRADCIAQVTGGYAASRWRPLAAASRSVSRLDLQVTSVRDTPDLSRAVRARQVASNPPKRAGRPTTHTLIDSSAGGGTCYLGAGQSETRGRLYDKGVESETHPAGIRWRWELQLRRKYASRHAAAILLDDDERDRIGSLVTGFYTVRGVEPPPQFEPCPAFAGERQRSDDDKRIDWLARSCAPVVARLARAGKLAEVIAALGLSSHT